MELPALHNAVENSVHIPGGKSRSVTLVGSGHGWSKNMAGFPLSEPRLVHVCMWLLEWGTGGGGLCHTCESPGDGVGWGGPVIGCGALFISWGSACGSSDRHRYYYEPC